MLGIWMACALIVCTCFACTTKGDSSFSWFMAGLNALGMIVYIIRGEYGKNTIY